MLTYKSYIDIDPEETYLIPLYSVPLLHLKLNNWEEKKSALMESFGKITLDDKDIHGNQQYSVITDYHRVYNNNDFSTTDLVYEYFCEELEFISDVFSCPIRVNNAWFEKSTRYKQHTPHNHGNCGLSCVVFIKFDPKNHCPTVFIDPNLSSDSPMAPLNEMPPGIREGSMIVFPSYLSHYTLPNLTDEDRIILSFNMCFDREKAEELKRYENEVEEPPNEYAIPNNEV